MKRLRLADKQDVKNKQAGVTLIETLMAGTVLLLGSLSMVTLILGSIATNTRNRMDSTQAMLATSVEQINSTFIGVGTSTLTDCAGTAWTISTGLPNTGSAGAALRSNGDIDFSETSPPAGYAMNYVVRTPCESTGSEQGTYDVRWHVDVVGGVGVTNTYLLTVGAKLKNHGEGNQLFALPVSLRVMSGN